MQVMEHSANLTFCHDFQIMALRKFNRPQVVKGDIDWDGRHSDDAILFMIGLNNKQDHGC